jgi:hypothetical protein
LISSEIFATFYLSVSSELSLIRSCVQSDQKLSDLGQFGGKVLMKTIFRHLSLGALLAAFIAVGATASFAQDPAPASTPAPEPTQCADVDGVNALYTKITENYAKKTIPEMQVALDSGKLFLEKYGVCTVSLKDQVDFVKAQVPSLEDRIKKVGTAQARSAILKRYDDGVQNKKYDDAYAAGAEFLSKYPNDPAELNIIIPLGAIGLYESYKSNNKFADDSIKYAKLALEKMKAGKTSNQYGAYDFAYKTKEAAVNEMTFSIAYLTNVVKNDKKGALPYYYEVSQQPGKYKDDPRVYQAIGSYYYEEYQRYGREYKAVADSQKPDDTPEARVQQEAQLKEKSGFINAYLERTIDSFGRAHQLMTSKDTASKTAKDAMYKSLQELYKIRFQKDTGFDTWVATSIAKPLPNPTSAVTPVYDPEPVKPVTTSTTTTTTPTPAKPASATPVKPTAVDKPAATTTAVKANAVAKKPVVRKKGTDK